MAIPLLAAGLAAGGTALLGGIGSALGTNSKNQQINKARREIAALKEAQKAGAQGLQDNLTKAYDPYTRNAGTDYDAWRAASQNYGAQQKTYADAGNFEFDLNSAIDSLMDPYLSQKQDAATRAMEGSAASAGKLNSSAALQGIAKRTGEIYSDAWKDALAAAQRQQQQEYTQWSDSVSRERQAVDQYNKNLMDNLSVLGALSSAGQSATTDLAGKIATLGQDALNTQGNLELARIGLNTQKGSVLGSALTGGLNSGASVLGALSKWA